MVRVPVTKVVNAERLVEELSARWPNTWVFLEVVDGQLYLTDPNDAATAVELQEVLASHDATADSSRSLVRKRVLELAQSAVGIQIQNLTAAQVRALVAILLFKAGAIDTDGRVEPLSKWVG